MTDVDHVTRLDEMVVVTDRSSSPDELALAHAQTTAAQLAVATHDADARLEAIGGQLGQLYDAAEQAGASHLMQLASDAWQNTQALHTHVRDLTANQVALVTLATRIWSRFQDLLVEYENLTDAIMTSDTDHPLVSSLYEGVAESAYHDAQDALRDENKRMKALAYNDGYSDGVTEHHHDDFIDHVADALGCGWPLAQRICAGISGDIHLDDRTIDELLQILYALQRQNGY